MNKIIKAGIIGGAGYTGGELIRILLNHPHVQISFVHSRSNENNLVSSVHQDLMGETQIRFSGTIEFEMDVLFLCLGHGESRKFLQENSLPLSVKIIDLANDFRLEADARTGDRNFIYGLPELNKVKIKDSLSIANPGCFATTIQLGLLPLAKAGLLKEVFTTGITGSTGAGQGLSATSHFSWRTNNIQAYKTLTHQHLGEIKQSLKQADPENGVPKVNFVPWRGDFARGIFISSQMTCSQSLNDLYDLFEDFYEEQLFVDICREPIFLKQVVNTNKCVIQLEKTDDTLVVHSAIDNLLKGASGQAVQNMNLMFGMDEDAGLKLKASAF